MMKPIAAPIMPTTSTILTTPMGLPWRALWVETSGPVWSGEIPRLDASRSIVTSRQPNARTRGKFDLPLTPGQLRPADGLSRDDRPQQSIIVDRIREEVLFKREADLGHAS